MKHQRTPQQIALGAVLDEGTMIKQEIARLERGEARLPDGSVPSDEERIALIARLLVLLEENRSAYRWLASLPEIKGGKDE
ncbi:hypothetical protein [Paraburkholderia sp. J8-2]|uniref:hypothetical protein n=1 Tax=Paraburkholderia sp. J8-2 TaxID=2805440 RepID=UPI002AB7A885|nr:hypothetical protein [Paraburkholderia sp. J8-2]